MEQNKHYLIDIVIFVNLDKFVLFVESFLSLCCGLKTVHFKKSCLHH